MCGGEARDERSSARRVRSGAVAAQTAWSSVPCLAPREDNATMRTLAFASLLTLLALPSCKSLAGLDAAANDPPAFEDVIARVALTQEAAFDALLAQTQSEPDTKIEDVARPSTFRARRGTAPAISYLVESVDGRSRVTVRRNLRTTSMPELRRWLQLVYGATLDPELWQRAVEPQPAVAAPSSSSSLRPARSGASGGTTHVRGYYRKDGTYVRSHTRRK